MPAYPEYLREFIERKSIPEPNSGCRLWEAYVDRGGYGRINYRDVRGLQAHRAAYVLARGPIPAGLFVCHKCDVPACVNPDHLFLGTHDDNMADMASKGRGRPWSAPGEKNPAAKLTEERGREILAHPEISTAEFARRWGVHPSTIQRVRSGDRWRHLRARAA
jgi:hypothetical protein